MSIIKRSPWISFFNAGGCIPGDTMMVFEDGDILTAEEIIEDALEGRDYTKLGRNEVLARACEAGTLSWNGFSPKKGTITTAYKLPTDGNLIEINTSTTRLRLTPEHKVLVDAKEGPVWKEAKDLEEGDHLYSPRKLDVKGGELPHIMEWLPGSHLIVLEQSAKEDLRKKLTERYGNLRKAADKLGISYKRLTHSVEGLSVKELKSISGMTGIDQRWISKHAIQVVKGTQRAQVATGEVDAELMYGLGLIASDGCISFNKEGGRKSYKIRFDNNEASLVSSSKKILAKWAPGAKISHDMVGRLNRVHAYHYPFSYLAAYMGLKGLTRKEHDFRGIFRLPEKLISAFLAGFFDGDGTAIIERTKRKGLPRTSLEIAIKEYKTAKMIQLLLKRLGIINKIIASKNSSSFGTRTMHTVRITTPYDIYLFSKKVQVKHPDKKKKIQRIGRIALRARKHHGKLYHAPLVCGSIIRKLRKRKGLRYEQIFEPTFLSMIENGKRVEKQTIERVCEGLERRAGKTEETVKLRELISYDSYLDPVKSIRKVKTKDKFVYNFNVAETHKYIPEGAFVVANCNGCTLECFACFNPRYDVTRFGMELKASAKHADVLLVTGIVNKQNVDRLLKVHSQLPEPKRVVAVGACAVTGGLYRKSYSTKGPLDKVIPVDVYVPGCPPRPESVIDGIRKCLNDKGGR